MTTWILVADRGSARIFSKKNDEVWDKIANFDFPEGRLREGETRTDRPSLFTAHGENQYAAEPHTDHRHVTAAAFSKELVGYLDHARQERRFHEAWIVAPPLLLGELRKHLSNPLTSMVTREWPKDLTSQPDGLIQEEVERLVEEDEAQ